METPTRILVIRFSSIGDIVLTTPIVRALKEQLDGPVEIHYITKKIHASLVEHNPYVDEVITIEKHVSEAAERLRETVYDYVVDLHNNLRSRQVRYLVNALTFTVDKRNLAKWLYVRYKREILPIGHFVERCFQCVTALGVSDDGKRLDFHIPPEKEVSLNVLPPLYHEGYVAYAIGGQMQGKILPVEKIQYLCTLIRKPIVLLGGPEDAARGEAICNAAGERVWNACGKFSIHQSASLLKQADVVIAHDTGLMHIAAALNKPVISLWLATTPQIGMSPWRPGEGSHIVEADCAKRPTSKLGNRGYKDGCVFNIDLGKIANLVNE